AAASGATTGSGEAELTHAEQTATEQPDTEQAQSTQDATEQDPTTQDATEQDPTTQDATYFFSQAEDGIRYATVTGVQTCALPILIRRPSLATRVCSRWSLKHSRATRPSRSAKRPSEPRHSASDRPVRCQIRC